jgi:hypothetical protein
MRVINRTAYDTRVLRYAAVATWAHITAAKMPKRLRIYFIYQYKRVEDRPKIKPGPGDVVLHMPPLNGNEWHHLLRQAKGIKTDPRDGDGPPYIATIIEDLCRQWGHPFQQHTIMAAHPRSRLPRLIPLKMARPPKPVLGKWERRLVGLKVREKKLTRKLKLMSTLVKKVQQQRRRVERRIAKEATDAS